MAGASRGAAEAGGLVVGILPGLGRDGANEWVQVGIPTGLGELRNGLVVRCADAVIAVGGAYGTLSEVALALSAGVAVVRSWDVGDRRDRAGRLTPRDAVARAAAAAAS